MKNGQFAESAKDVGFSYIRMSAPCIYRSIVLGVVDRLSSLVLLHKLNKGTRHGFAQVVARTVGNGSTVHALADRPPKSNCSPGCFLWLRHLTQHSTTKVDRAGGWGCLQGKGGFWSRLPIIVTKVNCSVLPRLSRKECAAADIRTAHLSVNVLLS